MNAMNKHGFLLLLCVASASMAIAATNVEEAPIGEAVERHLSLDKPFGQWVQDPERIESEMGSAAPEVQWTMNCALAEIGIHFPDHRERALAIGETLGIYRDYPVSKGCTSPFAPIWINEMVSRQG